EPEVAERAVPVPELVPGLRDDAPRLAGRQLIPRLEPLDTREAVAELTAPLAVEEVGGERLHIVRVEAERGEPGTSVLRLHAPRRRASASRGDALCVADGGPG